MFPASEMVYEEMKRSAYTRKTCFLSYTLERVFLEHWLDMYFLGQQCLVKTCQSIISPVHVKISEKHRLQLGCLKLLLRLVLLMLCLDVFKVQS